MGRQAATDRDPGDEDAPRPPTEVERVQAFKEQQLIDAGFNIMQAAAIVDADADWHDAIRLVRFGCDHELAIDILT